MPTIEKKYAYILIKIQKHFEKAGEMGGVKHQPFQNVRRKIEMLL